MRPFNPDRVNSVKNPVHLSGKTELTPFVKEIQCMLILPQGLHTNKMVTHAGPSAAVRTEEGKGGWCKSHIYNANNLSFSEHRVYSHSYRKPMSTMMADLMTSQVHSTHAITLVAEKKGSKTTEARQRCWGLL